METKRSSPHRHPKRPCGKRMARSQYKARSSYNFKLFLHQSALYRQLPRIPLFFQDIRSVITINLQPTINIHNKQYKINQQGIFFLRIPSPTCLCYFVPPLKVFRYTRYLIFFFTSSVGKWLFDNNLVDLNELVIGLFSAKESILFFSIHWTK